MPLPKPGSLEEFAAQEQIQKLFNGCDSNLDGTLSTDELRSALCAVKMKNADVQKIFTAMDKNRDGRVDIIEFCRWLFRSGGGDEQNAILKKITGGPSTPKEAMEEFMEVVAQMKQETKADGKQTKLRDVFNILDDNGSGQVSLTEFKEGCKRMGYDIKEDMLKELFDEIDVDVRKKKKPKKFTEEEQHELIAAAQELAAEDPSVKIPEFHDGFPKGDISSWMSHEKVWYVGSNEKKKGKLVYDPHAAASRDHSISFKEFKQAFKAVIG